MSGRSTTSATAQPLSVPDSGQQQQRVGSDAGQTKARPGAAWPPCDWPAVEDGAATTRSPTTPTRMRVAPRLHDGQSFPNHVSETCGTPPAQRPRYPLGPNGRPSKRQRRPVTFQRCSSFSRGFLATASFTTTLTILFVLAIFVSSFFLLKPRHTFIHPLFAPILQQRPAAATLPLVFETES